MTTLVTVSLAAVFGHVGVEVVRRWVERKQVLDIPNERSSHDRPVPRGGGLAIVSIVLLGAILLQWLDGAPPRHIWTYALASGGVAIISWLDDVHGVSMAMRLAVHLSAAMAIVSVFKPVSSLHLGDRGLELGVFALPLAIIWIAGLTNAYNFMDGIDGIAGQQAVIAAAGWLIVTRDQRNDFVATLAALLLGSAIGFLLHNWPPARIFMGDIGSAFIGFTLATLPLADGRGSDSMLIGVLLVWPFIFDASFTFLRRLSKRERVFSAHRSHLYQRLTIAGHSHAAVSSLYVALSLVGVAAAEAIRHGFATPAVAITLAVAALLTALVYFEEWRSDLSRPTRAE